MLSKKFHVKMLTNKFNYRCQFCFIFKNINQFKKSFIYFINSTHLFLVI